MERKERKSRQARITIKQNQLLEDRQNEIRKIQIEKKNSRNNVKFGKFDMARSEKPEPKKPPQKKPISPQKQDFMTYLPEFPEILEFASSKNEKPKL